MLKYIKIFWIFYKKLLVPTVLFSLLFNLTTGLTYKGFGLSFLLIFPLMHFFIYELRMKNEYIFYANFGLSKVFLWTLTLSLGFLIKILTAFL